ncbi:unnamed protein product [Urochloa decumbens]
MRIDYDFLHTLDANILRGDMAVKGPAVRLFKPFDELFIDSQAMLFLSFDDDRIETFKSQFYEAAKQYGDKNISFLIGDVTDAQGAFQYFGLKESEVPLLFIQASAAKYIKPTVEPDQIVPWLKEYTDGTILPHVKSDSIPLVNYQPVKVVVADNLNDVVFNSGKNVLLEFYGPWCGHCQKLAPILDEVAVSLQNDAKMDATTNDIPPDFAVEGYSTMYFYSSAGNLLSYERGRTAEEIINSIKKNKGSKPGEAVVEDDAAENDAMEEQQPAPESVKDQL